MKRDRGHGYVDHGPGRAVPHHGDSLAAGIVFAWKAGQMPRLTKSQIVKRQARRGVA